MLIFDLNTRILELVHLNGDFLPKGPDLGFFNLNPILTQGGQYDPPAHWSDVSIFLVFQMTNAFGTFQIIVKYMFWPNLRFLGILDHFYNNFKLKISIFEGWSARTTIIGLEK